MLIVQKHLQAVTKALLDKEVASIGELLDEIGRLQDRIKELLIPSNAPHSEALKLQAKNERLKEEARSWRSVAEKLEREKQALKGGE